MMYPNNYLDEMNRQMQNQMMNTMQIQNLKTEADFSRQAAKAAQMDALKEERKLRNSLERINARSTRKGFIVLLGLLSIVGWFIYEFVIDRNEQMFFGIVLVLVLIGAYAFWKMVRNDGPLVGNVF